MEYSVKRLTVEARQWAVLGGRTCPSDTWSASTCSTTSSSGNAPWRSAQKTRSPHSRTGRISAESLGGCPWWLRGRQRESQGCPPVDRCCCWTHWCPGSPTGSASGASRGAWRGGSTLFSVVWLVELGEARWSLVKFGETSWSWVNLRIVEDGWSLVKLGEGWWRLVKMGENRSTLVKLGGAW